MREKMNPYKKFVNYLDYLHLTKDYEKEINFIEKFIKKGKILIAACFTGNRAKLLSEKGYSVSGFDLNPCVLDICRKKVKGNFFRADMKDFKTSEKFDGIICLRAINYNLNEKELKKTFSNFKNSLKKGGLLIFDMGLKKGDGSSTKIDEYHGGNLHITRLTHWEPSGKIYEAWDAIFIKKNGKFDFGIHEYNLGAFSVNEIIRILENSGFDASVKKYDKKTKRKVFVCRKN